MHKKLNHGARKIAPLLTVCAACVLGGAVSLLSTGCRTKLAPVASAPMSVETAKAQARDKQVQQYILKRRAAARKASKTHTVH